MKNRSEPSNINRRRIIETLKPSGFSLLIAIVAAVGLIGWVILSFEIKKTGYAGILTHPNGPAKQPVLTLPGQNPPGTNSTSLQNTWPLIAFWGVVGLVVYFIVDFGMTIVNQYHEFNKELNFVHTKREMLIKSTYELLAIRLVAVIVWLFFIDYFLKTIIPNAITFSHNSIHAANMSSSVLEVLVAFILMVLSMHINTIFLRIALRRPRIFSPSDYLDV